MVRKHGLPQAMRRHAATRTDTSLQALFKFLKNLEIEVSQGRGPKKPLDLKAVSVGAGLNPKFLYGKKHNSSGDGAVSTKVQIERRLKAINEEIGRQNSTAKEADQSENERLKSEIVYWRERYERLARHVNLWFVRMREQQRRIRDLQKRP